MKRPELDRNGGHPKNRDRDNFQFATPENLKVGTVITSTPAGRGNPTTKEPPTHNKGSGSHSNLNPGLIWKYS